MVTHLRIHMQNPHQKVSSLLLKIPQRVIRTYSDNRDQNIGVDYLVVLEYSVSVL